MKKIILSISEFFRLCNRVCASLYPVSRLQTVINNSNTNKNHIPGVTLWIIS